MKIHVFLLTLLWCGTVLSKPNNNGNFSVTCTLTEKRQVTGGMLVATSTAPKQVKVNYLDGGFMFNHAGVMYSSPRLNAAGVATTPQGQQYIYSKDDRAFSVADGEKYFELSDCK